MRPGCKVWALKGQRPLALHRTREWLCVYLFVHPAGGRGTFLILPTVNSGPMRLALREFQQERGAEGSAAALTALHPRALPGRGWCLCCGKRWPVGVSPAWRLCESVWQSGVSIGAPRGHPGGGGVRVDS